LLKTTNKSNIVNSIEMRETGCVYDVFKFKITGEEPSQSTLTFALLDRVDHEPVAKAEVILYMNGNEKKIIIKDLEYTVSKDERNQVVQVENNSVVTIHVKNASDRCKLQENSECEWYFVKGDLDSYGYIDYLGSTYTQEKDTYDFKFKFENLTAADVLPNLEFSYGPVSQSRSDVTPVDTLDAVVVHLANVGQVDLIFNYNIYDFMKDTIRKELKVKRNSIVQIQLSKTCFSTNGIDYHWYLLGFNEDENLGALNLEGTIKENQFPLPPGSCKDEVFKFRVKGRATEPLPTLKFVHHEEGKMVDPQYVYVQLKMTSEGEEEKPLKEAKKAEKVGKSTVVFAIYPESDEVDLKVIEEAVRKIKMDGVLWSTAEPIHEPFAFGITMTKMGAVVTDDVEMEDLEEAISEIEGVSRSEIEAFQYLK